MKTPEQRKLDGFENKHRALVFIHVKLREKAWRFGVLAVLSLLLNGSLLIALDHPFIGKVVILGAIVLFFQYVYRLIPKFFKSTSHTGPDPELKDPSQCYCTNPDCAKCLYVGCTRANCIVHSNERKAAYKARVKTN